MTERGRLVKIIRDRARPLAPEAPERPDLAAGRSLHGPVAAVLFDLYGTLFVSGSGDVASAHESVPEDVLAHLLHRCGLATSAPEVLARLWTEIRLRHERERAVDFPEVEIDRVWQAVVGLRSRRDARRFAVEFECVFNPVWPMPHAAQLIDRLRSAGTALGIISNAQFYTPLLFESFFQRTDTQMGFRRWLCLYSYRYRRAKPSPWLFERARAKLCRGRTTPEQVLFVGNDMLNDIVPASRAGFQTCLFAGDRRSLRVRAGDPRCAGVLASIVVTSLQELGEVLDGCVAVGSPPPPTAASNEADLAPLRLATIHTVKDRHHIERLLGRDG